MKAGPTPDANETNKQERNSSKMRLKLKQMIDVLVLAAAAAMLVATAVGISAAGASEYKTSGSFPVSSLGEGLGASTFLTEQLNLITCQNSHSKGSIESSSLAKGTITLLTSCELVVENSAIGKFKEACPTITSKEIDIKPISKLNGGTKTGLLAVPASGTILAEFTCSGANKVNIKISGSVICESTPIGVLTTKKKESCKQGPTHGSQEFTSGTYTQESRTVTAGLTAESALGIFKITEKDAVEANVDLTSAQAVEKTA